MKKSNHAKKREQQRGISEKKSKIIKKYGSCIHRPGNAVEYRLTRRKKNELITEKKREIKQLESASDIGILCGNDGCVITVYHITK